MVFVKFYIILILIVFAGTNSVFAELIERPVVLSPEKEAWLTGNVDSTLALVTKMINSGQNTSINNYNAGYMHMLLGDNSKAMPYLQKSLELPDATPYANLLLAQIYRKSGFASAAYQYIEKALQIDPENYDFLLESALLNELLGRPEKAIIIYKKVIEIKPDGVQPRVQLAKLYRGQKKYTEASAILNPENSVYPEKDLLIARSQLAAEMGDKSLARETLLEICQAFPYAADTKNYLDTLATVYGVKSPVIVKPAPSYKFHFIPAEKMNYKVTYGFITLGWVNVRVGDPVTIRGKKTYPVRFYINTNPDFGMLLELHHVYESYIEAGTLNAMRSRQYTPDENGYLVKVYDFYYEENRLDMKLIHSDGRFKRVDKMLPSSAQDAVSMLYFARGVVSSSIGGTTTVVIDEDYKYGRITFLNEKEEVEVIDKDVEAIKIFARADFKGIAGMNGDAWGWFSDDGKYVPLVGEIKILLGSITVEMDASGPLVNVKN